MTFWRYLTGLKLGNVSFISLRKWAKIFKKTKLQNYGIYLASYVFLFSKFYLLSETDEQNISFLKYKIIYICRVTHFLKQKNLIGVKTVCKLNFVQLWTYFCTQNGQKTKKGYFWVKNYIFFTACIPKLVQKIQRRAQPWGTVCICPPCFKTGGAYAPPEIWNRMFLPQLKKAVRGGRLNDTSGDLPTFKIFLYSKNTFL